MTEPILLGEEFLKPLHRHFINLMCLDSGPLAIQKYGKPAVYNFSAFVVEVQDRWIAITAGHIFKALLTNIEKHGSIISHWSIDDSIVSQEPKPPYPISLDINRDVLFINDEVPGIDYAYYPINNLARRALEEQGITAIPQSAWNSEDLLDYPFWLLLGTPLSLTDLGPDRPLIKHHATVHVERVNEVPDGLEDTKFKRLYAKINFGSVMHTEENFDIGGMSGGPIFGLKPGLDPDDYRLIGIQSSWDKKTHIAMCAAQPFIRALLQGLEHET